MSEGPLIGAAAAVETAVGDEQDVADGVGFLGGFDGISDLETAAFVFSIGEQDHRLAPDFVAEFVVRGEIDGVIERGAALATGRNMESGLAGRWDLRHSLLHQR